MAIFYNQKRDKNEFFWLFFENDCKSKVFGAGKNRSGGPLLFRYLQFRKPDFRILQFDYLLDFGSLYIGRAT